MVEEIVSVLLIEDDLADARVIQGLLGDRATGQFKVDVVDSLAAGHERVRHQAYDVVLLDLDVADSHGLEALYNFRSHVPDLPVLVMTGRDNEREWSGILQEGAQDYLVKGHFDAGTLSRALRYSVERHQIERALRESEQRFRFMFEQNAVGMAFVNLDGRFLLINHKLCHILGYEQSELLQKTFADITHPDDLELDWANVRRLLSGEQESYWLEKRYIRKDGSVLWAEITVTLARTESGVSQYFLGILQDISQRKKAEEARLYLSAIVENSEDGILGKSLDGTIISWNAGAERIYGYTAEEVIGRSISILFLPGSEHEYQQMLARIQRGERISRFETRRVGKDGTPLDIALTMSPIKNQAGDIIGISAIERNITMLKWAQAMQKESEERLRQLTENIDEVLWLKNVQDDRMLYVSPAYSTIWGLSRKPLYEDASSFLEAIHPDDLTRIREALERHSTGGFDEEYRIIPPGGEQRWIHARSFPIKNAHGEIYRVAGVAEDITDQKRLSIAEHEQRMLAEALRDTANALNSTLNMSEVLDRILTNIKQVVPPDAAEILLIEKGVAHVVRSQRYAERGLQGEPEQLSFTVATTPNLRFMAETGQPLMIPDILTDVGNIRLKRSDAHFWRSYAGVPIRTQDTVIGFINLGSMTPDFFTPLHADRLQGFAEQAAIAILNARLHEQVQELAAHRERQRLARDLHDAVSQTLFSATITAEALLRQWNRDPASIGGQLADLHRLARGALAETRAVLLELRPDALLEIELEDLLRQLIEAIQSRKRVEISLSIEEQHHLPPDLKLGLYRIIQESLNNVVKHSGATHVDISLDYRGDYVRLDIRDDGKGFDVDTVQPSSMGLHIMRERVETLGATLTIESQIGSGTHVMVLWSADDTR